MTFLRRFQDHPASVGETYLQHAMHAMHAMGFGWSMLMGSPQLDEMHAPQPGDYLAENI